MVAGEPWQMGRAANFASAVLAVLFVGASGWVHVVAGWTFPPPWDDEAHFILPALELARGGSLAVPLLNAPDGIFWLPHGYYALLAPLMSLPFDVFSAARWSSFVFVVIFAASVVTVAVRRGVPTPIAAALAGAWLLLPRVVIAGNVARMEAALLAATGVVLVLAERNRWPAASGVGLLAALVHPIAAVFAAFTVGVALVVRPRRWVASGADWAFLAFVVVCLAAEAAYVALHAELALEHLRFQFERKATRDSPLGPMSAAGLLVALAGIAVLLRRIIPPAVRSPFVALLLVFATGGMLVAILGQELWYEVLGVEFAALLLVLVVLLTLSWTRVTALAAVVVFVGAGVAATYGTLHTTLSAYDFRIVPQRHSDWPRFVDNAVADLEKYDRRTGRFETVLIDPQSAITPYLHGRSWNRLRFVASTPVTPFPMEDADLLLVAPGPRASLLYSKWGASRSVVTTTSPDGRFKLLVMPR